MVKINIDAAIRKFQAHPNAVKWYPEQDFKNVKVAFEKQFVRGNVFTGIDKVVKRADGQVLRGHYTPDGILTGSLQKSSSGTINTCFGGQKFDKVTTITTSAGDTIIRLGQKGRPQSFIDSYHPKYGIPGDGNFSDMFNRLKTIVQNSR